MDKYKDAEKVDIYAVQRLKNTINTIAVLSFLLIVFYMGFGLLHPLAEKTIFYFFGADVSIYEAMLAVYEMFSYCLSFFLPLAVTMLTCHGTAGDLDISFTAALPGYPFAAIFAAIGVLYVVGAVSDRFLSCLEAFGLPLAYSPSSLPDTPLCIILYFLSSVILPAFVEELIFRGYVLHLLLPYGKTFAILVSAVLFGVMHLYLPQLLYAAAAGALIGYFVVQSGSLWIGILIHLVNNLFSFITEMAYAFLSESSYLLFHFVLQGVLFIFAMVSLLILFYKSDRAQHTAQLESGATYTRLMATSDAFRSFLTVPLLAYLICAGYFIVINSFILPF